MAGLPGNDFERNPHVRTTTSLSNWPPQAGGSTDDADDHHRVAAQTSHLFRPETWESDRTTRFQIQASTASFHRSVPALAYLNWSIEKVERGYAETRLPLNVESSNQYITQQAALMLLAADYTGGIALSTLFEKTPIIGFHAQPTDYGAYLWGAAATIKWLRPSTDDLICKSTIPPRDWDRIAATFRNGEEVNYKARIRMYDTIGKIVAVADFQYWARDSRSLRATGSSLSTTHHMLSHKVKTSARLIAGLRSRMCENGSDVDPYASRAAGPQGIAMASKFSIDTPQLAELVRARTIHCDKALKAYSRLHERFVVVNVCCGYDSRPWRMRDLGGAIFVNLDLPTMMHDRERALPQPGESSYQVLQNSFDILSDDLSDKITEAGAPVNELPMFFIWEGGSMYFTEEQGNAFLCQVKELMCPKSRLWFDHASDVAVHDRTGLPEVKAFIDSMRMIGEPFVRGVDDAEAELGRIGFVTTELASAARVVSTADPVFKHYSFSLCGRQDVENCV